MVVAVLANRFAPSSRGLKRAERKSTNSPQRRKQKRFGGFQTERPFFVSSSVQPPATNATTPPSLETNYYNLQVDDGAEYRKNNTAGREEPDGIRIGDDHPWRLRKSSTGHRRKPFRAMACLTSLASDIDVISDWVFFHETLKNDREYRAEYALNQQNGTVGEQPPYLIPPILLKLVLISCIVGTAIWLILATDGRVAAPILRRLGIGKLSIGVVLFLCVLLEDIPQVILTFLIEDYYEEDYLSTFAVCNVMASLYDTLIKIAEAFDERNDMVETGVWCKHSIEAAHSETITAIVTLLPEQQQQKQQLISDLETGNAQYLGQPELQHQVPTSDPITQSKPLQQQQSAHPLTTTDASSLRFLTASLDGSIRLWDTSRNRDESSSAMAALPGFVVNGTGSADVACVRSFEEHTGAVTCLALLGQPFNSNTSIKSHISNSDSSYFLSGYQNGTARLWNIDSGAFIRDYRGHGDCPISSIAVVKAGSMFVTGYQDGTTRLWDAWSGSCLALYRGHRGNIRSLCAMGDGMQFVTGSDDRSLRLWNINSLPMTPIASASSIDSQNSQLDNTPASSEVMMNPYQYNSHPAIEMTSCHEIFQGHTDAILSVACMECGTMFVSGSMDRTARLWSVESGECLQVFSGHSAGVSAVAAIDEVTLLTGSYDTSVKVWDALRGTCLRTYTGHSAVVTGISVTDDDTTFVTSSADRTVKLWVLTALPTDQPHPRMLDQVIEINDGLCRGLDPD